MILLSILIPTVLGREESLNNLLSVMAKYSPLDVKSDLKENEYGYTGTKYDLEDVEIIVVKDNKQNTIGAKREYMYSIANGLYSQMTDDDDELAPNAIHLILEAIRSNPEIPVITFKERCMINGEYKSSNHSIKYEIWQDNFDGYSYVRCPFYKDVIRTDIAKSIPFPRIRYNEDEQWSMAIKSILTDEIHIDSELYYYNYEPKESHEERYGITEKRNENSEPTNY